jgi:hypothetical protein
VFSLGADGCVRGWSAAIPCPADDQCRCSPAARVQACMQPCCDILFTLRAGSATTSGLQAICFPRSTRNFAAGMLTASNVLQGGAGGSHGGAGHEAVLRVRCADVERQ